MFGDPSAAPADGVRFAAERPVPIQHQLPSAADPWGRIEYVDGFIHYRLVGRGDVVDSAADGSTVGMSLADGRTQVVVGDTWGSEEWVIDPNGGDSWQSTLSWQIEVPSGWSVSLADHMGAGDELFIQDSDGWNRVTVKAPSYTDETGAEHPLNMTWDANTSTMSVVATPIIDGAVGSIAVDPVWVNDAAAGQFEYQICPGTTNTGTACSAGTSTSHTNWNYDGSTSYGAKFNYGSTTVFGRYVGTQSNISIPPGAYARNMFYVPTNLTGQAITWKGNYVSPNGNYSCKIQGVANGSTVDSKTIGATGDFTATLTRSGATWTAMGVRLENTSAVTTTSSTNNNSNCTEANSTGGQVNAILIDNYSPAITSPETDSLTSVHWKATGYWYNSTADILAFGWTTSDSGSGTRRIYPVINGVASTTGTNDPCLTQSGNTTVPCPTGSQSGSFAWKMSKSTAWHDGDNTIALQAIDFSGQSRVSTSSTGGNVIQLDRTIPSAPSSPVPDETNTPLIVGGSNAVTLSWTAGSDTGSGIGKYLVCASRVSTGCDDATAGAPTAYRFASATTSVNARLASGKWYWRVRSVDRAENISAPSTQAIINIDAYAPSVALTSPADLLSIRSASTNTFAATASDDDGNATTADSTVASVTWQYRRADSASWTDVATDTTSPYSASAAFGPSDGEYELRAIAPDSIATPNVGVSDEQTVCVDTATLAQPQTAKYRLNGVPVVAGEVWWTAPSSMANVVGYLVQRHDSSTGQWTVVSRTGSLENSASDPAATPTTDSYRVESIGQRCTTTAKGNGTVATSDTAGTSVTKPYGTIRVGGQPYWQSVNIDAGANATASANLAGGNLSIAKPLATGPGAGVSATPVLIHNSQERGAHTSSLALDGLLGEGWTLGLANVNSDDTITSLTGISLDPIVSTASTITVRDQDGTPLTFNQASGGTYTAPLGTFAYLRDWTAAGESSPSISGAVITATRPDRTSYYWARPGGANPVEDDGRLLAIRDRDGRGLTINYDCVQVSDTTHDVSIKGPNACSSYTADAGYVLRYRPSGITNQGGRTYQLSYFDRTPTDADRSLDGRLNRLTDFAGRFTDVGYDRTTSGILVSPRLHTITDAATTSIARSTTIEHDLNDDPPTLWVDESQLVTRVIDPRGNTTKFAYATPDDEDLPRVSRITDRNASATGRQAIRLNYAVANGALTGTTSVSDQLNHTTTYKWDSLGRVIDTIIPTGDINRVEYNADGQVTTKQQVLREDEPQLLTGTTSNALAEASIAPYVEVRVRSGKNQTGTLYTQGVDYTLSRTSPASLVRISTGSIPSGATVYVTYINASTLASYDANTGMPVSIQAAKGTATAPGDLAPAALYTYTNVALGGRVADLATFTSPRGSNTPDPDDFTTTYTYDANLRVSQIISPINQSTGDPGDLSTSTSAYYANGDLKSQTDNFGNITGYSNYDASGQAQYQHAPTTGSFDPATTPVAITTVYDAMGGETCTDDKQEAGDSVSIAPCVFTNSATLKNGDYTTNTYDALGRVTAVTNPFSMAETSPFTANRRKASTTTYDANDNAISTTVDIGYDPDPTDPWNRLNASAGVTTLQTYDTLDNETTTTLPANDDDQTPRIATNVYDAAGNLVSEVDPEGTTSALSGDHTTTHLYDDSNREIGTIDGVGALTCNYYNRIGSVIAVSEPLATPNATTCPSSPPGTWTTTRTFDRAGRLTSETDETGRTTTTSYDDEDNVVSTTAPGGATHSQTLSASGDLLSSTDPLQHICTDAVLCDAAHQTDVTPSTSFTYTKEGEIASRTDARQAVEGNSPGTFVNAYSYDQNGNLSRIHLADDGTLSTGDDNQYVYQMHNYDGRLTGATLQTKLTPATAPTDADVQACRSGATYADTIPCTIVTTWKLTADGSVAKKSDPTTATSTTDTYNVNGQLDTHTEHGITTSYTYYADDSVRTEAKTKLPVDYALSWVFTVGQCVNPHVGAGTLYTVTDSQNLHKSGTAAPGTWPATGSVTNGDVTFTASTCTDTTQHYYDRTGAEIKTVQSHSTAAVPAETYQVHYSDGDGRPLRVQGFDGSFTNTTYDLAGNKTKETVEGRTTTWTYGSGSTTGLVTKETMGIDTLSPTIAVDFTYDAAGRVATVSRETAPNPTVTTYTYDNAGNITNAITQLFNGSTPIPGYTLGNVDYAYDADGRVRVKKERVRRANPATKWTASTALALGTVVEPTTPNSHQYVVTTAGTTGTAQPAWPIGERDTVASGGVTFTELTAITQYAYDGQGRLVREARADDPATATLEGTRDYHFDDTGRLATITAACTGGTGTATLESYTYSSTSPSSATALNKYHLTTTACSSLVDEDHLTITNGQGNGQEGAITTVVDDPGVVGGATTTIRYSQDDTNHVATTAVGANPTQVTTRDALGRPESDTTASGTVTYQYAAAGADPAGIAEVTDEVPAGILTDPNGLNVGVLYRDASENQYIVSDPQNSSTIILDTGGYVQNTQDYDAYGQRETLLSSGNSAITTLGYTGTRTNPLTGLIDHQARSYSPVLRTWTTTDELSANPSGDQTLSVTPVNQLRLAYVGYDPVNNTDPDGHMRTIEDHNGRIITQMIWGSNASRGPTIVNRTFSTSGTVRYFAPIRVFSCREDPACRERWQAQKRAQKKSARDACHAAGRSFKGGTCHYLTPAQSCHSMNGSYKNGICRKPNPHKSSTHRSHAKRCKAWNVVCQAQKGVSVGICGTGHFMFIVAGEHVSACVHTGLTSHGPTLPNFSFSSGDQIGVGLDADASIQPAITLGTNDPGKMSGHSNGILIGAEDGGGAEGSVSVSHACGDPTTTLTAGPAGGIGFSGELQESDTAVVNSNKCK